MAIFRYEMKQNRKTTIIWALSLAILVFLMMPMYINLMTDSTMLTDEMKEATSTNPIFAGTGGSIDDLFSPLGAYSFVTSFAMMAFAVYGMYLGLTMISKDYVQKTADFLMTKPYSRAKVLLSKLSAATLCCLIVGLAYVVASISIMQISAKGEFEFIQLLLIALSTIFIQLFFMTLGMFIAVIQPLIRMPVVISMGVAFVTYICGAYSGVVDNDIIMLLSPYKYFGSAYVMAHSTYNLSYALLFFGLMALFIVASFIIFIKKDIKTVS
ncbi:ABC-2 type transport system permease protein [Seinonella peptonophila]|uniref:ABC-2 type transport system permease protein n=1 Tax=Seinonella peptonophila TaxID=112248 RepID=A0A1M4T807_9BACL|nr:ABC transporter permease subunit [Seinonella peptonophila]SHE40591.1 ABC-2 type transport system permease protein [Seinonella peptonophila]